MVIDDAQCHRSPEPGSRHPTRLRSGDRQRVLLGIVAGVTLAIVVDSLFWPIVAGVVIAIAAALALRFGRERGGRV